MTTNEKIIPLVFLIVGLGGGFVLGVSLETLNVEKPSASKDLAGYRESLKARAASMGILPPQMIEVKQLLGSIKSINDQTVTVALQYPRDLFGDPMLDERSVIVDSNTKIMLLTQKDSAVFKKEMDEFQSRMNAQKPEAVFSATPSELADRAAPELFDKKVADISALEAGQIISITAAENVKDQKSFVAATIEISSMAPTPSPVTP